MRKFIFLVVLIPLVAPWAAADAPVEFSAVPDAAATTVGEGCADSLDGDLEALFAELGDASEQENKIICPESECDIANDCYEKYGEPTSCDGTWYCAPMAGGCGGSCICDPYWQ